MRKKTPADDHLSPIVQAIADAERLTTGEIRVHVTRRRIDKDPLLSAEKLFREYGMQRTRYRNAVLLYVNLRKRQFAVFGDEGVTHAVGNRYWEGLARALKEDLLSTHWENAVALAVRTIGFTLAEHFPAELDAPNPNELPDTVSTD